MVRRIFVEKKPGFDVESVNLLADLKETLGIKGIENLRLFNRYDAQGLSESEFERAKTTIFSEPNVDIVYDEILQLSNEWKRFSVEYLPGQYDQRADSAAQCIQLLTQKERPALANARVYAFKGKLTEDSINKIKKYVVNPVESRIASEAKPQTLDVVINAPDDIETVDGFTNMSDSQIAEYHSTMGFAMTAEDLCFCRDYFKTENRDPFVTELKVIDTYWSDHCRHTTFSTELTNIKIEKSELTEAVVAALKAYFEARSEVYGTRDKKVTLMDMATMGTRFLNKKGMIPDLDESEEINACSIEAPIVIDGKEEMWLIQFKNETHNHPTEIEPFGGAATCLGGAIRDPLSGRAYVYQAMRVTGAADPTVPFEDTMESKLPQKKITKSAAAGYSSYGNQIGLATGQVTELYHKGYVAKRMEIGAVVGASPKDNVYRGTPKQDDIIVLLGGRTGRDGCGGATGSSKAHDSSSIETCGAEVQKGNPITERKIQRLFRNAEAAKMIKCCNDFGAGGVCVAIGELAPGLKIDLDLVPKKYDGLNGTELAISESQERMAVVLSPEDVDKFAKLAANENLETTCVAVVTEENRLIMKWRDRNIVDISRDFLNTNGVTGKIDVEITAPKPENNYRTAVPTVLKDKTASEAFLSNLSRLQVCCQKGLGERFDASIGANTVIMPYAGKYQMTPEDAMVAKIPVEHGETDDATAFSYGFIPGISEFSPFHGAVYAVMESLAKLAAVGADSAKARLTFQEYFERLKDVPSRWGKPTAALLGALTAQLEMGVPAIGGKDSMSGTFNDVDVPPTLVSFALSMTKASTTGSSCLKNVKSKIALLPLNICESTQIPDFGAAKKLYKKVTQLVVDGKILAANVVKDGGTAASIAKMAFGDGVGVDFCIDDMTTLFAPLAGSLVVQVEHEGVLEGLDFAVLGTTNTDGMFRIGGQEISVSQACEVWQKKLEPVFPIKNNASVKMNIDIPLYSKKSVVSPAIKTSKPRVFIPVFPGTNCEVDTARAFERAGAIPEILVIKNINANDIEETAQRIVKSIDNSQIIMFPGGFSGGDEPDGSGKFIATTFRGQQVKEAVDRLLNQRDGLILGICNGFQALIKLGLVPYGEIRDQEETDPALTFNTLGRHISRMVYTRVASVKSPWLSLCEAGDMHTIPISHGEGRFVANDQTIKSLMENGQIATQYVDFNGNVVGNITYNPNGSVCAIEGITSPNGRVFGKMGHSERVSDSCYKNVPGSKNQKIFEAGVHYFR